MNREQRRLTSHRPWGDLLSDQLLDDLKAWNNSWDFTIAQEDADDVPDETLEERGRVLAVRVQDELGTDGWEVLYFLGGQAHRVHPPGSWPEETWEHDLLGFRAARPAGNDRGRRGNRYLPARSATKTPQRGRDWTSPSSMRT